MANSGSDSPQVQERQIQEQINDLFKSLETQGMEIKRMEKRLEPALKVATPLPDGEGLTEETLVPIADQLRHIRRFVSNHTGNIQELLDRLEI